MDAYLGDIVCLLKKQRADGRRIDKIDRHKWKKEVRDLITITKQVSRYLKNLRY